MAAGFACGSYGTSLFLFTQRWLKEPTCGRSSSFSGTSCTLCKMFLKKPHNVPRCYRRNGRLGLIPGPNKRHCVRPVIYTSYAVGLQTERLHTVMTVFAGGCMDHAAAGEAAFIWSNIQFEHPPCTPYHYRRSTEPTQSRRRFLWFQKLRLPQWAGF